MKFAFLSLCVFAAVSTSLISCSNGDYSATPGTVNNGANPIYQPPANGDGTFKATISGNSFVATSAYYIDTTYAGIHLFQIFGLINADDPSNLKSIQLQLNSYNGVGTYKFNVDSTNVIVGYIPSGISSGMQSADSGTIVITSFTNNKVSGTFQFTTDSGVVVTNGSFNNLTKL